MFGSPTNNRNIIGAAAAFIGSVATLGYTFWNRKPAEESAPVEEVAQDQDDAPEESKTFDQEAALEQSATQEEEEQELGAESETYANFVKAEAIKKEANRIAQASLNTVLRDPDEEKAETPDEQLEARKAFEAEVDAATEVLGQKIREQANNDINDAHESMDLEISRFGAAKIAVSGFFANLTSMFARNVPTEAATEVEESTTPTRMQKLMNKIEDLRAQLPARRKIALFVLGTASLALAWYNRETLAAAAEQGSQKIQEAASSAYDSVSNAVSSATNAVSQQFDKEIRGMTHAYNRVTSTIAEQLNGAAEVAEEQANNVTEAVTEQANNVVEQVAAVTGRGFGRIGRAGF